MNNNNTSQKEALIRIKIAKGHLEKVIKMLEDDTYCLDVIHQSRAVQAALQKVDEIILEKHLKSCVTDSIRDGDTDSAIKEVMEVFKKK